MTACGGKWYMSEGVKYNSAEMALEAQKNNTNKALENVWITKTSEKSKAIIIIPSLEYITKDTLEKSRLDSEQKQYVATSTFEYYNAFYVALKKSNIFEVVDVEYDEFFKNYSYLKSVFKNDDKLIESISKTNLAVLSKKLEKLRPNYDVVITTAGESNANTFWSISNIGNRGYKELRPASLSMPLDLRLNSWITDIKISFNELKVASTYLPSSEEKQISRSNKVLKDDKKINSFGPFIIGMTLDEAVTDRLLPSVFENCYDHIGCKKQYYRITLDRKNIENASAQSAPVDGFDQFGIKRYKIGNDEVDIKLLFDKGTLVQIESSLTERIIQALSQKYGPPNVSFNKSPLLLTCTYKFTGAKTSHENEMKSITWRDDKQITASAKSGYIRFGCNDGDVSKLSEIKIQDKTNFDYGKFQNKQHEVIEKLKTEGNTSENNKIIKGL